MKLIIARILIAVTVLTGVGMAVVPSAHAAPACHDGDTQIGNGPGYIICEGVAPFVTFIYYVYG